MPSVPVTIASVVLTGRYIRPDGTPLRGTITFEPPAHLTFPGADIISVGIATAELDETGAFTTTLIATDAAGGDPADWTYTVVERLHQAHGRTFHIALPTATPVVDLADIAPTDPSAGDYVVVTGPQGAPGSKIYTGTGGPLTSVGADGDYYFDTTPGAVGLYGPRSAGAWPSTGVALGGVQLAEKMVAPTGDPTADAAAINAAISAMSTFGGGRVRLTGQPWTVSSSITPRSNVTLTGSPGTTMAHTANSNIVYASGVAFTNFTVEGITFQGTVNEFPTSPKRGRTTSGPGAQTAIFMSGDLDTTGSGQAQLSNFTMRNCVVKNCSALPIRIGGVRGTVSVTNCRFENCQDVGFVFCEEVIFNDNHVLMSADNGVSLSRGCRKITCVGNTIENCAYNGIWLSGFFSDKGPTNFVATGNVVRNVGHNGIYADYAAKYGAITGNEIDLGYFRGPSDEPTNVNGCGIYLGGYPTTDRANPTDWAQGITVVGNHIRTAARAGIYMNGVKRIQVVANQISDVGTQYLADGSTAIASTDATQNVGILLENATTSSDVTVALNSIVESRSTSYTNYGVVPQNTSSVNAYLNSMVGTRQAFNLLETGPTRTWQSTQVYNQNIKATQGVTAGSNAGTGTIQGFDINGAAGSIRAYSLLTAGLKRWYLRANGDAESGSNAGSNFEINAYDDAGNLLSTPVKITRSTGQVAVNGLLAQNAHRISGNASVTIAAGAQATTASAGSNGANDSSGTVSATAVASPAAGTIVTVTYASAYASTPKVVLTPRNSATASALLYVTAESGAGFSVATANAPAASASLAFHYHVEG